MVGTLFAILALAGVVGSLGWNAWRWYHAPDRIQRRVARRLRRTAIARVQDRQRVKITGRLELLGEPLRSPLSHRACAAWIVDLEEETKDPEGGTDWRLVLQDSAASDFRLVDDSGIAIVRLRRTPAHVVYERDGEFTTPIADGLELAMRTAAFLEKHGRQPLPGPHRLLEGALEPGEEITVVGVARREAQADGYRTMTATRVVLDQYPLVVLDGPIRWRWVPARA